VRIPPLRRLRATVTPTGSWNPALQLVDTCTTSTSQACLASNNSAFTGQPETLDFVNSTMLTRDVFLAVDTNSPSTSVGTFSLSIAFLTVPAGDVCGVLSSPLVGSVTGQDFVGFSDDYASAATCATGAGPDRVYSVSVGPGERLNATLTATPDGGSFFQPSLSIVAGQSCSPGLSCAAAARSTSPTTTVLYDNPTPTPQTVSVIVDSSTGGGTYALTTSVAPAVPLPGDQCTNTAAPVSIPSSFPMQSFAGYVNHFTRASQGTTCAFDDGPDRVYAVSIPSGLRLRARVDAAFPYSVSVIDGPASNCSGSPTCLARFNRFGGPQVILQDNPSMTPRTVFLVIDRGISVSSSDTFDLSIDFGPVPSFDTCSSTAVPITASTTLVNQSLAFAADDVVPNGLRCGASGGLPDLIYPLTVGAGARVTVTATSMASGFEPLISLVDAVSCSGSLSCVAAGPVVGPGAPRAAVFDNLSMMSRSLLAIVEPNSAATGPFTLAFSFGMAQAPYVKTTIAAACVPLGMSAVTHSIVGDDVATSFAALPFAFTAFGAPVTAYAVSSNGNLQLDAMLGSTGSTSFSNTAIPTPLAPNGMVAALWDDLEVRSGITTVQSETQGVPGSRRFVTAWQDSLFLSSPMERLTFQIHLLEGSNVIEIHYCSLAANGGDVARTSGGSATVGIESADGTRGLEHSLNTANSIMTGLGLRFTPAP
jgi:hypothetical protein